MKTIIAEAYQKNKIYHDLAAQNHGIVTDVQIISLRTAMQEDRDDPTAVLLQLKDALCRKQDSFPIYRDMFQYPSFLEEVLSFAGECLLWGITKEDLPADNANEEELQRILEVVFSMDLAEKKIHASKDALLEQLKKQDITLFPVFYPSEYQYEIFQQLAEKFPLEPSASEPKKSLHYGLNTRQEIEAAAQQICRHGASCNLILTNYSTQYPVVKQVFTRYGIPFSCIHEEEALHIPHLFAALCRLAWKKDKASFLQTLKLDAYRHACPLYLITYLDQRMTTAQIPEQLSGIIKNSPFSAEAATYQKLDEDMLQYMASIQEDYDLLLSSSTPQEVFVHAYQVMQNSSYLNEKKEFNAARNIRSALQTSLPSISEEEIPFLIETIDSMHTAGSKHPTDFCMVTDLRHPVSTREESYVLGCSGRNYPGFPAMTGLFDEAYVQRTKKYPSMALRHQSYMDQLKWIAHSASKEIHYSYATNDYAGHEIELSLEVESLFQEKKAEKWALDVLKQPKETEHTLAKETASSLFTEGQVVTGSISTIEKWFQCPYAYFIQCGLKVRGPQMKANDAASVGTIQHAFLQNAVNEKKKNYPEVTEQEIRSFLQPYFDTLKLTHPNETERITVTNERMVQGLQTSILFLKDMEQDSSFEPEMTEQSFLAPIADGVTLRGVIDRVDTCNDLVRVVDYKSSSRQLSEKSVKAGISLQLLSYLIIAEAMTKKKPAGAYYFSLKEEKFAVEAAGASRNVVNDVTVDEDLLNERLIKTRRMKGWTFEDRIVELDENKKHIVSVGTLMEYDLTKECMKELYTYFHDHLLNGEIGLTPVENACTFCEYRSICRFSGDYRPIAPVVMKDFDLKHAKEAK